MKGSYKGQFTTEPSHRPPAHQAVIELNHERILRRAEAIGEATAAVIRAQAERRKHRDETLRSSLGILAWVNQHLNVLLSGPTGVGKSYLACALAHQACRQDYSVRYFRVPRLTDELLSASAQQKRSAFFKLPAKADLLVLDDFGLTPLAEPFKRDLLEIVDDRFDKKSTLITSQMPVEAWHAHLDDPTLADAILDRLVHNAYQIELKGESMRKRKPQERATKT